MAWIGRLKGALLAETEGRYFLVGQLKRPCEFPSEGFSTPALPAGARFIELHPERAVAIKRPRLALPIEREALAEFLASRFVIERTGLVSERLWRLIFDPTGENDPDSDSEVEARWLAETPAPIWQIVREAVLKCS